MEIRTAGAPAHTRTLGVSLYEAGAGELEARGSIVDLRKRGLVPMASELQAAGVIHDMRVTARLARGEPPRFRALEVEQPSVAFEPSPGTGGECCRDPAARLQALVGTPLDEEAPRRLGAVYGGALGCSHVLTLAQLLLSTLRTALALDARRFGGAARVPGQRIFHRSLSIDGIDEGATLRLILQLADLHLAPVAEGPLTDPFERLAGRLEVRVAADVAAEGMELRSLRAAERTGSREDFPGRWRERGGLECLTGRSALSGMAGALFELLGGDEADRPLLDTLLNLAPGVIQCIPALLDRWEPSGSSGGPARAISGGMPDSCYMWRKGGAMMRLRAEQESGSSG